MCLWPQVLFSQSKGLNRWIPRLVRYPKIWRLLPRGTCKNSAVTTSNHSNGTRVALCKAEVGLILFSLGRSVKSLRSLRHHWSVDFSTCPLLPRRRFLQGCRLRYVNTGISVPRKVVFCFLFFPNCSLEAFQAVCNSEESYIRSWSVLNVATEICLRVHVDWCVHIFIPASQ